jgi:phytoene dehydrogenase-like protein
LIDTVVKKYIKLGGEIHFHKKVEKIIVEKDQAAGIKLTDGSEVRGDIVISAADGHKTIFEWLEGKYLNNRIRKVYDSLILFPPLVYVSLGISANYADQPHSLSFTLKRPIVIGPDEIKILFFKNYSFDPSFAPPGKCVFTLMLSTSFDYWNGIKEYRELYLSEKKRIGEEVVKALGDLYPDLPGQVEVMDVATPMTFVRYSGNWRGSYEGWLFDKQALALRCPQTLPGLKNLYMVGQWVSPGGGLPSGPISARSAMKKICKTQKKKFVTTIV